MSLYKLIENEIKDYKEKDYEICDGYRYNQYRTIKRIWFYMNGIYQTGKFDSQGKIKYWFDICTSRVNSEIKNIDFDTKDIEIYSEQTKTDFLKVFLSNARLKEWMRDNNIDEEINESIEDGSSWGNVVWKKVKGGFERMDLLNFMVLNPKAKDLSESNVIERHILTQSELRGREGVWKNVDEVIKGNKNSFFDNNIKNDSSSPVYEVFERNGEITEKMFNEAKGKSGGSEDKYIIAKVIVSGLGTDQNSKNVLYAEKIKEMGDVYKEYHRSKYTGLWFRKGLYELLYDCQTRANEIGNQLARGLEWSSKTVFRSSDRLIAQNILTDLNNGDIIKSTDLKQVETRMQGFDQLIADWNKNLQLADSIANSPEVVTGENLPSGTPFRLGALQNINAKKLFDYIQEKLGIVMQGIFMDWLLPELLKDLKNKDIIRITGEDKYLKRWYELLVDDWYLKNLLTMPPHNEEFKQQAKDKKLSELLAGVDVPAKVRKGFWDRFKPRVNVVITGENVKLESDLETLSSFVGLEQDSVRRTALIEMAMMKKGIDVTDLPKTELPQEPQQQPQGGGQPQEAGVLDSLLQKQANVLT